MPTRFYISNSAPTYTPSSPLHLGAWTNGAATTAVALTGRPTGATTTVSVAIGSTTANRSMLVMRAISAPAIAAGTISGTVQWVFGVLESNAALNAVTGVHIWVSQGNSTTARGTLVNLSFAATEWPTTYAGRSDGSVAVSSVAVQVGDRIVVEMGYRASSSATTYTGTYRYGGTSFTDLSNGGTDTTQPPWIEFSSADGIFSQASSALVSTFDSMPSFFTGPYGATAPTTTGGRLRLTAGGTNDYTGTYTAQTVAFTTDGFYVEIPTLLSATGATLAYAGISLVENSASGGRYIGANIDTAVNLVSFYNWDNYFDASAVQIAYNASQHRWLRVRRSGAQILWDTSPDGTTWTNRRTLTTGPSWMNYQTSALLIEAYKDGASSSFAEFDNLNTVPASQNLDRSIGDTVTLADAVVRVLLRPRGAPDTVTVAEALARLAARSRSTTDTVTGADSVARALARPRAGADTVALADTVARALARPRAGADTVAAVDTVARLLAWSRATGDTVTAADTVARIAARLFGIADAVTLVDSVARTSARPRGTADTVTVAEALTRAPATRTRSIADTVTLVDSVARAGARTRAVADAVLLVDAGTLRVTVLRGLADTVTPADSVERAGLPVRAVADTVALLDSGTAFRGAVRDASDFVFLDDTLQISGSVLARGGADTVDLVDSVDREFLLSRELADTVGLADTLAALGAYARELTDQVTAVDAAAHAGAYARAVAELVALADAGGAGQLTATFITDTVTVADAVARAAQNLLRPTADLVALAEAVAAAGAGARTVADVVALVDAVGVGRLFTAGIGDAVQLVDVAGEQLGRAVFAADAVHAVDAASWGGSIGRDGSDFVFLGDANERLTNLARFRTDLLTLADTGRAGTGRTRGAGDAVHLVAVGFAVITGPVPILIAAPHSVRMVDRPNSVRLVLPLSSIRRTR